MKLKRFVAKDMRTALAKIKEELGAEAVIMSNKRVGPNVEIIAGVEG
jgi:flagellar biosynthesis protein FlhF